MTDYHVKCAYRRHTKPTKHAECLERKEREPEEEKQSETLTKQQRSQTHTGKSNATQKKRSSLFYHPLSLSAAIPRPPAAMLLGAAAATLGPVAWVICPAHIRVFRRLPFGHARNPLLGVPHVDNSAVAHQGLTFAAPRWFAASCS